MTLSERIERIASAMDKEQCPLCEGTGSLTEEDHDEYGYRVWEVGCRECDGNGWVIREPCIVCGAPVNINRPVAEQDHDAGCMVAEQEDDRRYDDLAEAIERGQATPAEVAEYEAMREVRA